MKLTQTDCKTPRGTLSFYTLEGASGRRAGFCSAGASLTELTLPDRFGRFANVVLRLAEPEDYFGNPSYAGASLGPNAGRIAGASLPIGGNIYPLSANDGPNQLHGGFHSLSFQTWTLLWEKTGPSEGELLLEAALPDGLDGYPGNRRIRLHVRFTEEGELTLTYTAETDRETYLNLSNHSYFQLSGDFRAPALAQQLWISAARYLANDASHLPEEIRPVPGTPFDFRRLRTLDSQMHAFPKDGQLLHAKGYNHAFFLDHAPERNPLTQPCAVLRDPDSGRQLTLFTDAPCLVLYSGGYLGDASGGRIPRCLDAGQIPVPLLSSAAIALEAQDIPDAPGQRFLPCRILSPGQTYRRTIRWLPEVFSIQ